MVLQNRLGYGFNGYQVPPTPRATRSPRRGSIRKKVDDNQMCAFDLLATVAGKLLLEGQVSPSSSNTLTGKEPCAVAKDSIKKEQLDDDSASKVEPSNLVSRAPDLHFSTKEFPVAHIDDCSVLASVITSSDCSEKIGCAEKLVNDESKIQPGSSKVEPLRARNASDVTKAYMCTLDELAVRYRKPPALISQENSVKVPLGTGHVSFPACRDVVNIAVRDDDENSSGCTQPSTAKTTFRPSPRIGDRRIRKILASKFWKAAPKLKDGEYFTAETKPAYHNRKNCYKRKRSLRDYPLKKRILYDGRSLSNSDGGITSEGISSSPRKGFSCDASGSGATLHGAFGTTSGVASRHTPFQSRDSHVKLRIRSFKVPELFIEIPETATVGSLKRSVLEAVNAIMGGGLRVGVLLQGKKIRDDNKTLLQTGLAHDNKLDALGFSLEPTVSQAPPPLCNEDHPLLLSCNAPQPLTRYPPAPSVVHNIVEQSAADALPDPPLTSVGSFVESDHDSAPSPPDMSDKSPMDSRALAAIPEMDAEALAVVPMRKSKRSEAVQRRIRRPFSVSEVEALVHAVEKLGTGRWRDVKLRAFDNAKHRTYVDLKDKWKTLVHTARISPQQRRGEPVPQVLLDRVLDAHAYWSQQQAKQQLKQQSDTCLLL
ncbi:telomere repeat-binding protein 5-like [Rhododendron vialii]|uniref:telomere repeat-binding protein 5-like n=1 Tax=Rhododendron vialii TaxID=182163 RepID=UPI00265EBAF3|nr:telomere repeat-binding protein 5-like [Rhododendron vialii]XP_058199532.1 telomere repeat-binding protein 5-like [Rhododendron vialii]XP_058199533.1 telomere repeat-binding protein 5-like [Rhododendron vialii]